MRIGVYVGQWTLGRLGGMGVYLRNLMSGAAEASEGGHELLALVDRDNLAGAGDLGGAIETVWMDRAGWGEISPQERREVIRVRRESYARPEEAEAMRGRGWSAAAEGYLWGLDDAVERAGIDVLYFTLPPYVKRPRAPVVLTIHDLKHLHRPQDHAPADLARRRRWRRVARSAAVVYASYEHVRRDIERLLGVPAERTAVVEAAVPTELREAGCGRSKEPAMDLPARFALMPAQYWPHKNHGRVIEAVAELRRRGLDIAVICTGQREGECAVHAERMRAAAEAAGVGDLVRQTGLVDRETLAGLYARSTMVIAATLYDPGSFPVMEALALGKPLIASNVTSIPETVGDAALLFDPESTTELADAMELLWTNEAQRKVLSRRGPLRIGRRTWADVGREWLGLCERAAAGRAVAGAGR
jgi:glycosyltransferase involved in cell wall biosynthesis